MQRMPPSSLRPRNSEAQRCGQRWSMTPTRPALSRNAISFSPSSISRTGAPSRTSSEDCAAGIQYCRINSPMTVPGPTCVSSLPSVAVVILPSRYGRAPLDGRYLITDRGCLVPPSLGSGRPLIGPEAGRPDHLAPLLGFRGDMLCEVGRRTNEHRGAEVGKPRLQLCIGEAHIDLLVEPVDDLDGRFPGRADAEPAAYLVARYEFSHSRDIRQHFRAGARGYGQRAKFAASDILDRRGQRAEHHLHLPGEQVGQCGRRTAIGYVHHVDAGHYFEQLAGHMRPGAVAGRRHIELAGIRLGIGDEFGDRLRRKRWMHLHAVMLVADARNRRDVTDEIVFELLVERRVDRVRYVDQKQRIAIGGLLPPPPRTCS